MAPQDTLMYLALGCSHGTQRHPNVLSFGVQQWDPTAPQCTHLWGTVMGPHGTLMCPPLGCSDGTPWHPDAPTFGVQPRDPMAP